jgi:curved DNA binding protein
VNNIVSHCSPLESDDSWAPLEANDMAKIDLGVHVDGFIAVVAHTIVVPGDAAAASAEKATDAAPAVDPMLRANVASAAWMAAEVCVKLIKAGNTNTQVTAAIKQVAEAYGVKPCANFEMLQMKKFVIDGNKKIALREPGHESAKGEVCTFEPLEVYGIDVVMSTGEGVPRETGARTTVYKRAVGVKYSLKNQSSRQYFNEVNKRFPTLPFSNRSLPDEKAAKMGVRECVVHGLLQPFMVTAEKPDALVAHVKCTVLLMPNGKTLQITGMPPSEVLVPAAGGAPQTLAGLKGLGKTLSDSLTANGVTLDADVMAIVQEVLESSADKKKAKKAAAAAGKK